ncbi:MAG TPA: glycosyltransferase [Labilithrix sp.]|nr:glycosyltransferase [Labilithrix sp.]
MPRPELSLVIPIRDEEDTLPQLDVRVQQLLALLPTDTEVVFVDDGSTDGSIEVLRRLTARESRYRVISLSRPFGYEHAVAAGMEKSRGRAVIFTDSDLHDASEVVPEMIAKWREGYDVVYGRRRPRIGESTFNLLAAKLFERVFAAITPIDVPRDTGEFRLLSRRVVTTMRRLRETHRFVRGLVGWVGFRQTAIEYDATSEPTRRRPPTLSRLATAIDVVTSFSSKPLRLASSIAFVVGGLSFIGALVAVITHDPSTTPPGWTTLVVLVTVLSGIAFLVLGVLGEYVGRIYEQVKGRPLYIVSERINFGRQRVESLSTSDLSELTSTGAQLGAPALPLPPPPPALAAASAATEASLSRPVAVAPHVPVAGAAPTERAAREGAPSGAVSTRLPVTPSAPPPKVTPSFPSFKAAASVPPAPLTPNAPPVKPPSVPPPAVTTSPFTKPPSIAPSSRTPSAPVVKAASVPPSGSLRSAPPVKAPSIAPPPVTPSTAPKTPSKTTSVAPPAWTPSAPPVKAAGSIPPKIPSAKTASIPPKDTKTTSPFTKTASIPPKDAKTTSPSVPPKSVTAPNDPKKLFGTGPSKDSSKESAKPIGKGTSVPPKAPDAPSNDERTKGDKPKRD